MSGILKFKKKDLETVKTPMSFFDALVKELQSLFGYDFVVEITKWPNSSGTSMRASLNVCPKSYSKTQITILSFKYDIESPYPITIGMRCDVNDLEWGKGSTMRSEEELSEFVSYELNDEDMKGFFSNILSSYE